MIDLNEKLPSTFTAKNTNAVFLYDANGKYQLFRLTLNKVGLNSTVLFSNTIYKVVNEFSDNSFKAEEIGATDKPIKAVENFIRKNRSSVVKTLKK